MRRFTWLLALLLTVPGPATHAQSGLNLYWDGCSDGGTMVKTFACNTSTGNPFLLYASVIVPADMPQFAAAQVIIDANFNGTSVPSWWQIAAGQCRANAVSVSFDPNSFTTNCEALWAGASPVSVFAVQYGVHGNANGLRLNAAAAVPQDQEISVVADGSELVVCRVAVSRTKTTGADACAGCVTGACLLLGEIKLQQPAALNADYTLTNPAANNFVMWNGYTLYWCGGVWDAARNRTWGQVKGLYR
jgi:hypothetical protein